MVCLVIQYKHTIRKGLMDMCEIKLESGVVLMPIPESPNEDYRAGSDGMIYSRTKYCGFGRKGFVDWYVLKGFTTKKGYQSVSMSHNNIKVTKYVHSLICSAFHGQAPQKRMQVRHLDGNPSNNVPNNLAWGTQAENWQDRRIHGTASVGEKHWNAKLTDEEREHVRWTLKNGLCSQRQMAKKMGISQAAICRIAHSDPDK